MSDSNLVPVEVDFEVLPVTGTARLQVKRNLPTDQLLSILPELIRSYYDTRGDLIISSVRHKDETVNKPVALKYEDWGDVSDNKRV